MPMDQLIVFGAKYLVVFVALGSALVLAFAGERRARLVYTLAIALPLGYALARLAGLLFAHPQPFAVEGFEPLLPHAVDNAFPSDHTLISGIFASVAFLADRRVGLALWVLALLVGLSRMLAGLHYSVDVAAAAVLAGAAGWAADRALKFLSI